MVNLCAPILSEVFEHIYQVDTWKYDQYDAIIVLILCNVF